MYRGIALACEEYGYDLTACEIDKEYFEAASKRLSDYRKQLRFNFNEIPLDKTELIL
jgi:DNA modification methylase